MKKYLAMYMMSAAAMEVMMKSTTPEERKKGMGEWMAWQERHKANIAEMGAPLGKNKRVTKDGVADVRNDMGGYSIIRAESAEAAAAIFSDNPHLQMPGAYVELMPLLEMS